MLFGCLVPHPPLIIPAVGGGGEIPATRAAYNKIASEIDALNPDTLVIFSPHSIMYTDYFHISPGETATGDFGKFRAPEVKFNVEYDTELAEAIAEFAARNNIAAGGAGERDKSLDHGVTVPLNFFKCRKIIRIGLSGLPLETHYNFGKCVAMAITKLNRGAAIIASGDMSHRLGGSYGFAEEGVKHDKYVRECLEKSDLRKILEIDASIAENAAECGLRSLIMLCGAMDGLNAESEVYSYEAPYGVGYLCAVVRGFEADAFVKLARESVENFVKTGKPVKLPDILPPEMLNNAAGVFVSIKKDGELRGCIGTISATTPNIALEIIQNGISACSKDPRFNPVTPDELPRLSYSVDVLGEAEQISGKAELDVKRYGVIVSSGYRRGLLLPNLDGVDTVDMQIDIALQKGGINPNESYRLERFEVTRHI